MLIIRNLLFKETNRRLLSDVEFLSELKSQLERFIQLKDRLDNKANNMIMMSGTIAVIFMGFGAFLLSNVLFTKNLIFPIITVIVFMAEVILTFFTIKYAINSYKLREYKHPLSAKTFYDDENLDYDIVDKFRTAENSELHTHFIDEYLIAINSYESQNKEQVKGINNAQKTFTGSIITIPIFAFFIIMAKFFSI